MVTRAAWRDATKSRDSGLSQSARHLALIMADYWKSTERDPILWCSNDVAADQMGVSVRTIARARGELVRSGWLKMVAMPAGDTAARFRPRIPEGCQFGSPRTDILSKSAAKLAADSTVTPQPSPQGPAGQDGESRSTPQKTAHDRVDTRDRNLLVRHMSNYPQESIDHVYKSMREGFTATDGRNVPPIDKPGYFALRKHAKVCNDDTLQTEWQGFFQRAFLGPGGVKPPEPVVGE